MTTMLLTMGGALAKRCYFKCMLDSCSTNLQGKTTGVTIASLPTNDCPTTYIYDKPYISQFFTSWARRGHQFHEHITICYEFFISLRLSFPQRLDIIKLFNMHGLFYFLLWSKSFCGMDSGNFYRLRSKFACHWFIGWADIPVLICHWYFTWLNA